MHTNTQNKACPESTFLCEKVTYSSISAINACELSHVQIFATPLTVAHQVPLSMEFPRQEYWSGLPFPPPGDLSDPGIELVSPSLAGRFVTTEPPRKPYVWTNCPCFE